MGANDPERDRTPSSNDPAKASEDPPEIRWVTTLLRDRLPPLGSAILGFLIIQFIAIPILALAIAGIADNWLASTPWLEDLVGALAAIVGLVGAYALHPFYIAWLEPDSTQQRRTILALTSILWTLGGIAVLLFALLAGLGIRPGGALAVVGAFFALSPALGLMVATWTTQIATLRTHARRERKIDGSAPASSTASSPANETGGPQNASILLAFTVVSALVLGIAVSFLGTEDFGEVLQLLFLLGLVLAWYAYRLSTQLPEDHPARRPLQDARKRNRIKQQLAEGFASMGAGLLTLAASTGLLMGLFYLLNRQLVMVGNLFAMTVGFLVLPWGLHKLRQDASRAHVKLASLATVLLAAGLAYVAMFAFGLDTDAIWYAAFLLPGLLLSWTVTDRVVAADPPQDPSRAQPVDESLPAKHP